MKECCVRQFLRWACAKASDASRETLADYSFILLSVRSLVLTFCFDFVD